jgi:ERF superfamily
MSNETEARDILPIAPDSSPVGMLAYAMKSGATIADLRELYALKVEWERDEARKAYHRALSDFKAHPVAIAKDKLVAYPGSNGKPGTSFRHATLGNVVATIAPALGRHQLSHSWGVRREGDRVHVTCKLTHALGHSEEITLDGALDTSGSKNNIQSLGSTITYLERYTLLAITGLATEDQDDDGGAPLVDDKAEIINDWLRVIEECQEYPALTTLKADCVHEYGHADKVPAAIKTVFSNRTKALKS